MKNFILTIRTASGQVDIELRCLSERSARLLWGARLLAIRDAH